MGSSLGWTALIDEFERSVSLYNPVTDHLIPLPDLPKNYFHLLRSLSYTRIFFTLSSDPLTSPADSVAVMLHGKNFVWCKIWDEAKIWNPYHYHSYHFRQYPVLRWSKQACFCNGDLYLTIGPQLVKYSTKPGVEHGSRGRFIDIKCEEIVQKLQYSNESYVVEMNGRILVVLAAWPLRGGEGYRFGLHGVNLEGGDDGCSWQIVESLGDNALFLSRKNSMCVKASEYVGCKRNCVYYFGTNHALEGDDGGWEKKIEVRMHNLDDGTDLLFDYCVTTAADLDFCSWFQPTQQV